MKRGPHGPITDPRSHGVFHEACCAPEKGPGRGSRERDVRRGVFYVEGVVFLGGGIVVWEGGGEREEAAAVGGGCLV